jgi:hypothetical protein
LEEEGTVANHFRLLKERLLSSWNSYEQIKDTLSSEQEIEWRTQLDKEESEVQTFNEEDYFSYIEQEGSFGSRAELYAISQIFKVNVTIWRNLNGTLSPDFDPPIRHPEGTETIHILMNQDGNHFDAIITPQ